MRFHRICTRQSDFKIACQTLFLEVKEWDQSPKLALVTTYSTLSKITNTKIKRNFANRTDDLLNEYKIIPAYRNNKNLKDYLVHSKLKNTDRPIRKKPDYFKPKQQVKNRTTNTMVGIKQNIWANTSISIIRVYLITCK